MFWGVKFYNDLLMQAGKLGNVQSELLLRKDSRTFTFEKGWAFPRRVYFNGDNCVMPSPENYPWLPNASPLTKQPLTLPLLVFWVALAALLAYAWWVGSRGLASFKLMSDSMRCTATGHLFIQFHGCTEEMRQCQEKSWYVCVCVCKLKGQNVFLVWYIAALQHFGELSYCKLGNYSCTFCIL